MENNNNKRRNDGRKYNKRKGRVKMIKNDNLPAPRINKAKIDKAKKLSVKAIKEVFGAEDEIWKDIAQKAKEGSFNHLDMLMKYSYGKPGESKAVAPKSTKAPVIQFINKAGEQEKIDNTVDIEHEDITEEE